MKAPTAFLRTVPCFRKGMMIHTWHPVGISDAINQQQAAAGSRGGGVEVCNFPQFAGYRIFFFAIGSGLSPFQQRVLFLTSQPASGEDVERFFLQRGTVSKRQHKLMTTSAASSSCFDDSNGDVEGRLLPV